MENRNSKKDSKEIRTRISLKNLSKKQKELLTTVGIIGGGLGLGAGLFSLYSMKNPDETPGLSEEALSLKNSTEAENTDAGNSVDIISSKPVTEITDQNISFGDAFKTAREISGPGGWFIWKGNIFNTYYKEEWETLSQGDKKEYLASIELRDSETISDTAAPESAENQTDDATSIAEEANISTGNSENTSDQEFSIDFNALNEKQEDAAVEAPAEEAFVQPDDLIYGEIINLDDDSDVTANDFFELPDDIEITPLLEGDLTQLDDSTLDSAEITEFPWESTSENDSEEFNLNDPQLTTEQSAEEIHETAQSESSNETEEYPWGEPIHQATDSATASTNSQEEAINTTDGPAEIKEYPWGEPIESEQPEIAQTNSDPVVVELIESDSANQVNTLTDVEEYPWGEPIHQATETVTTSSDQAIENQEEAANITENPAKVKEYPWGEPIESEQHATAQSNSDVVVGELVESGSASQVNTFSDIDEYPWGEPVNQVTVTDPSSSDQANASAGQAVNIISDPAEVKEYPWGESIESEQPEVAQTNSDLVAGELIESDSTNQVNTFSDIEEYPWGEKNDQFLQASTNPLHESEVENIGVILPEEPELETNQKLPTSFNDVTEFPWGETVPHTPDILGDLTNQHPLTGELE